MSSAYLIGNIDFSVFIAQSTNSSRRKERPGYVSKHNKQMYRIRQASRIWGSFLVDTLHKSNFKQASTDECTWFKINKWKDIVIAIVLDDTAFVSSCAILPTALKNGIQKIFEGKLLKNINDYMGWEVSRNEEGICISQLGYIMKLSKKYGLDYRYSTQTSTSNTVNLRLRTKDEKPLSFIERHQYRTQVGELLHVAAHTRSDIIFAVCALARSLHAPSRS